MSEFGRISGPLLKANLERDGVDLAFETDLVYLSVVDSGDPGKPIGIGIRNDSPQRALHIGNDIVSEHRKFQTTDLIVDLTAEIDLFTISLNKIQNLGNNPLFGEIVIAPNPSLTPTVTTTKIGTANLRISDKLIENITNNSDINLTANGAGSVIFTTATLDIDGEMHSTGNITYDGNITFGSNDLDNVTFDADIASDLIPNVNDTFNLGTNSKQWRKLYVNDFNIDNVTTPTLTVNGIDLLLTQGNVWYVSVNGNDSNVGDHLHNTFRTIKYALSQASAGDEIVIFPGTYQEEWPLTIPQGVTVKGAGIRSVTITPTAETNDKNCFLLNGETTVEFLTIRDFFYNSIDNTGYAFAFAPGYSSSTKSPYIYNVTVITSGSVTTTEDPRGFAAGDAGGGAYLDGSVADPLSPLPPTGLFFSTTFITPNQDGITATNGVRVEWLNSFTYFAKRGIYLLEGPGGGAEMRSINSANVYGTYGAVADGPNTLGYLIGHNFGYVGTNEDSNNDQNLVIQANEVLEINDGQIYYDSVDHKGDYRIGDIFYVNQETGSVTFNANSINFLPTGNITLEGPTSTTTINAQYIETGNLRIYANNIDSLTGPVNWSAFSGFTYLNTDVDVTGNIVISNDLTVDGTIYLGNDPLDTITVNTDLTQDIIPAATNLTIGDTNKRWNVLYANLLNVDDKVQIDNNTISILSADTDLIIDAVGTGKVLINNTDVDITNSLTVDTNLTVNGETDLQATGIVGTTTFVGAGSQLSGDFNTIGTFQAKDLKGVGVSSYFEVPDIKILNNEISVTAVNNDLNFNANGTGGVVFDGFLKVVGTTISNVRTPATTDAQRRITLTPSGTGNLVIDSTKAFQVPVGSNTNRILSSNGEIRFNNSFNGYEGYASTGNVSLSGLYSALRDTYITPELTIGANDDTLRFATNNVVRANLNSTRFFSNSNLIDLVNISGNTINQTSSGLDMNFITTGTASLNVNSVGFTENTFTNFLDSPLTFKSTGTGYVKFAGSGAIVIPSGTDSERRLTPETGEIRNNTEIPDQWTMEVFDGTNWIPAVGTTGAATQEEIEDTLNLYSLILG